MIPIHLDPGQAPRWLRGAPDRLFSPGRGTPMAALKCAEAEAWLRRAGYPRPTLWQWECERARRGYRAGGQTATTKRGQRPRTKGMPSACQTGAHHG